MEDILMSFPFLISAEAIVWSKGKKSLFLDENMSTLLEDPANLKKFYGDPQLTIAAVKKLKEKGFVVSNIGKFGITFKGSRQSFRDYFKVEINVKDPASVTAFAAGNDGASKEPVKQFDPKNTDFADLLARITLLQPVKYNDGEDESPNVKGINNTNFLTPEMIKQHLQENPDNQLPNELSKFDAREVTVAIADSGFYLEHPYFKKNYSFLQLEPKLLQSLKDDESKFDNNDHDTIVNNLKIKKKELEVAIEDRSWADSEVVVTPQQKKDLLEKMGRLDKRIDLLKLQIDDLDFDRVKTEAGHWENYKNTGHGTQVITCLLSIVNNVKLILGYNVTNLLIDDLKEFVKIPDAPLSAKPNVYSISCDGGMTDRMIATMSDNLTKGCIYVFAVGNAKSKMSDDIWKGLLGLDIILVGGAFWRVSGPNSPRELTASEYTRGKVIGKRKIPDICALSGQSKMPYLVLPVHKNSGWAELSRKKEDSDTVSCGEGWILVRGASSMAAPQVAGVCALLKQRHHGITATEVKEILNATSIKIKNGKTADDVKMEDIGAGLVDLPKALSMASVKAALLSEKGQLSEVQFKEAEKACNEYLKGVKIWTD